MSPELIGDTASTSMASTRPPGLSRLLAHLDREHDAKRTVALLKAYLRAADRPVAAVKKVRRGALKWTTPGNSASMPVAGGLEDAAAVSGDRGVDERLAMGFEAFVRAFLIRAHQPRIAGYIAGENCGEAADRGHLWPAVA